MDYHFIVVFIQCCSLYSVISGSTITVGPHDTDAIAGGNVILHCTVQNLGGNTVVWRDFNRPTAIKYSENRTIVAPSELKPSRYKITGNDTEGTFNLEITGITELLDGFKTYECTVTGESRKAQLQVYDNPPSPTCSVPRRDNAFVEGEDVDFECTFESTIPQVEMNLTRNGNTLARAIVEPGRNFLRSEFSTSFNATSDYNGALLRCSVDHQILSMPYYCSLTLNVMYKPIVEISYIDVQSSFTCDAMSNPSVTQYKWSLCFENTDNTIDLGDETQLKIERRDLDLKEPVAKHGIGSNVSCYNCTNAEPKLSVLFSSIEHFTIPEHENVTQCSIKCSVSNIIGEGNDEYNTLCVITDRTIIIVTPESQNIYYYIIGGVIGGTFSVFVFTMIVMKITKTAHDKGSVTATQMTPYSNSGYVESCENQKDNVNSKNPSKNPPKSTPGKDGAGNAHDRDALPMVDYSRRNPEGDVKLDAMIAGPQYAAVNKPLKSAGRGEPLPDVLKGENGVKYTSVDFSGQPQPMLSTIKGIDGNTAYAELDYNAQP